jgi:hypothetical protein
MEFGKTCRVHSSTFNPRVLCLPHLHWKLKRATGLPSQHPSRRNLKRTSAHASSSGTADAGLQRPEKPSPSHRAPTALASEALRARLLRRKHSRSNPDTEGDSNLFPFPHILVVAAVLLNSNFLLLWRALWRRAELLRRRCEGQYTLRDRAEEISLLIGFW